VKMRLAVAAAVLGATAAVAVPATATAAPSVAAAPAAVSAPASYWYDTGETYNKKAACNRAGQWWKDNHTNVIRWRCDWTTARSFHLYLLLR
jgi:curli biogenesis system outer membrane secretion channel CsgG